MNCDVSKLRFDICITYDCDEGEQCNRTLNNGTYDEAVALFSDMKSRTWIDCYYHYMSIDEFGIYDENGNELELCNILDGEYEWIEDYSSFGKKDASEVPGECLKFLKKLKNALAEKGN